MTDKVRLHAQLVQIIGRDAEARKNAIPRDAPDWLEQRQEIKQETHELLAELCRQFFGKHSHCVPCVFYEFFCDWLYDAAHPERVSRAQSYLEKRKHERGTPDGN